MFDLPNDWQFSFVNGLLRMLGLAAKRIDQRTFPKTDKRFFVIEHKTKGVFTRYDIDTGEYKFASTFRGNKNNYLFEDYDDAKRYLNSNFEEPFRSECKIFGPVSLWNATEEGAPQQREQLSKIAEPATRRKPQQTESDLRQLYCESILQLPLLHHLYLDVLKIGIEQSEFKSVQPANAALLIEIGEGEVTTTSLQLKAGHLRKTLTDRLQSIVECGLVRRNTLHRPATFRLTEKGECFRKMIISLHAKHNAMLEKQGGINYDQLSSMLRLLSSLDEVMLSTSVSDSQSEPIEDNGNEIEHPYGRLIQLIQRTHRHLLDDVRTELIRLGQHLTGLEGVLLYDIGDKHFTARELLGRVGPEHFVHIERMIKLGFLTHARSRTDRRSVRISLSNEGQAIRGAVGSLFQRRLEGLRAKPDVNIDAVNALRRLERYWNDLVIYRL
ncbi:hypothetical protein GA0061098_102948 [Bradyrhizobium shewense]|uniref:DNA-binding transcriptional regulator, MarR family n=1 Tax=Bradyrhizobium shewense TaxID=1761772 RepID=A0A1C3XRC8_9BRAD|nr:hypothetical protein [Bradyrhizobium shewense]SCB54695.1 hypothetical protein GA0061098_102948 [Bradyrhizobium shewense]